MEILYILLIKKKINYKMKSGVSQVFPPGTIVAFFLGADGIKSNRNLGIQRNEFSAVGVSSAISLKAIDDSLVVLTGGTNPTILVGNLNEFNALNSLSTGFSLYSTPPAGFLNFDCFNVGFNWKPLS